MDYDSMTEEKLYALNNELEVEERAVKAKRKQIAVALDRKAMKKKMGMTPEQEVAWAKQILNANGISSEEKFGIPGK